jgi:hypothetical protein
MPLRCPCAAFSAALFLVLVACSSSKSAGNAAQQPPGTTSITYTMESTVAASTEAYTCQFFTAPTAAGEFIVGASHTYTPGSHHMIFFRTDLDAIPAGQEAPQDCYEGPNGGVMTHIRGIIYGAQTPAGELVYPSGVGLPVQSGEVFLMETHYLNAGASSLDVRVDLTLQLSDSTGIATRAGVLFFYDPFIDVPPASTNARAQMRCPIPDDVTLITAASHYHARGVDYAAYLDPATGPAATIPFYASNDWNHPAPLTAPVSVPAGSRIRFVCQYLNTDPAKEYFQGPSATSNEMCMFVAVYYPEMDAFTDFCRRSADMFGTGAATCGQTLTCIQTCAANGAAPLPPGLSGSPASADAGAGDISLTDIDPCYQKCFVDSCGPASAKILALSACTRTSCAAQCAAGTSSACQACAVANCGAQVNACLGDNCAGP